MPPHRQTSFAGGELAPELHGRTEIPKYGESVRTLRNWFVTQHGAAKNRPGSLYRDEVKDSTRKVRFLRFLFAEGQNFLLVLNAGVIRFYLNGALVLSAGVAYEVGHTYTDDELRYLKTAQSGDIITICHRNHAPAELRRLADDNWTLGDIDWVPAAANGGIYLVSPQSALHIPDPIAEPFLAFNAWDPAHIYALGNDKIQYTDLLGYRSLQNGNVNHTPPTSPTWWEQDSYVSTEAYSKNDYVYRHGILYISLQDGNYGKDPDGGANATWWALAIDSTHPARPWVWKITVRYKDTYGVLHETLPVSVSAPRGGLPRFTDRPIKILVTGVVPNVADYKVVGRDVYVGQNGTFGIIDSIGADATTFVDDGASPDFTTQPPRGDNPFEIANGAGAVTHSYPAGVTYFEGRRVFFGSAKKPSTIWGSSADSIANYDRAPIVPTARPSYEYPIVSRDLEELRGAAPLSALLMFAGQGEFAVRGDVNGAPISPLTFDAKQQSSHGSGWVDPLIVGRNALYVQAKGNTIRDAFYDYNANAWDGEELSALAQHLFRRRTIVAWAYAAVPWKLIWAVRDDGVLISISYDRSRQMVAFGRHYFASGDGTDAVVEDVQVVPSSDEDVVYLAVRRSLTNALGATSVKKYIECFASRHLPIDDDGEEDVRQAVFLDSALTFNGRNTGAATMRLAGATFAVGDQMSCIYSDPGFTAADVGDAIVFDPDGAAIRARIIAYVGVSEVTIELDAAPTARQAFAWGTIGTTDWAFARRNLSLPHLLDGAGGKSVGYVNRLGVLADGNVAAYATDWDLGSGTNITLVRPAVDAVVGLQMEEVDLELLDISGAQVRDKTKLVRKVAVELVSSSRGLKAGTDEDHLDEWKQRDTSDEYAPVALFTGVAEISIKSKGDKYGRVLLRQTEPLPITVVGVTREVEISGD